MDKKPSATSSGQTSPQGFPSGHDPLAVGPSAALCGLGVWFWLVAFVWLWVGCPAMGKALGLAWFALGIVSPRWWLLSLALLLPLFGSNPGDGHMLYLIDMGLMGVVMRHLGERAAGGATACYGRLDPWIALFVLLSWICVIPQWQFITCEWQLLPSGFLYAIYNHFATAEVFGVRLALDLTLAAGLYSVLRDRPFTARWQRALGAAFVVGLMATAVAGLANYASWLPLDWWRGVNPDLAKFSYPRLQSLFWHSGWLAQYLAILTPLALAAGLLLRRSALRWSWWIFAGGVLSLTQLLTFQRGGWMALAGAMAVLVIAATLTTPQAHKRRLGRILFRLAMVACALGGLTVLAVTLSPDLRARLGELLRLSDRLTLWRAAWELIRYHFWGGVGLGNYFHVHRLAFALGHPFYELRFNNTAHNLWLHVWAERGLAGLLVFSVIQVGVFVRVIAGLRRCAMAPVGTPGLRVGRVRLLAVLGGLTALTIDGLVQYVFHLRIIELLFWMLAGLSAWPVAVGLAGQVTPARPVWPRRLWVWPLIVILFAGVVGWENRTQLQPWQFYLDGEHFRVGKSEVTLALPPGALEARAVHLPLACFYPHLAIKDPVTFTISLDGQMLKQITFHEASKQPVDLKLPPMATPGSRLAVRSSLVWSPYAFGLRKYPFMEMGVLYRQPTARD